METPTQMFEPPLLRFMRALDADGKEAFAAAVGTTLKYLHQLNSQPAPNPNLRLALAIEAESHRLSRQLGMPPVTLPDLLVGRIASKQTQDHTTGEIFALLPNGELVRRRVDKLKRIVLVDARGEILGVEDSHPGPATLRRVKPLSDEDDES